jgi:hypothetical protein
MMLFVQAGLGLINGGSNAQRLQAFGISPNSDAFQAMEMRFQSVMAGYAMKFVDSTISMFETKFQQVEGMNEEISLEVEDFLRESFMNGPDFMLLRQRLHDKF